MDIPQNGTNKRDIKQQSALRCWRSNRGNISNICEEIGIDRKTFYNWLKDPEFAAAVQDEENSLVNVVESALVQRAILGNTSAIKYYLEHKHPDYMPKPKVAEKEQPPLSTDVRDPGTPINSMPIGTVLNTGDAISSVERIPIMVRTGGRGNVAEGSYGYSGALQEPENGSTHTS